MPRNTLNVVNTGWGKFIGEMSALKETFCKCLRWQMENGRPAQMPSDLSFESWCGIVGDFPSWVVRWCGGVGGGGGTRSAFPFQKCWEWILNCEIIEKMVSSGIWYLQTCLSSWASYVITFLLRHGWWCLEEFWPDGLLSCDEFLFSKTWIYLTQDPHISYAFCLMIILEFWWNRLNGCLLH